MDFTFEFINGITFGVEHIGRNDEEGIDESAIVISFAFMRWVIWLCDFDE